MEVLAQGRVAGREGELEAQRQVWYEDVRGGCHVSAGVDFCPRQALMPCRGGAVGEHHVV